MESSSTSYAFHALEEESTKNNKQQNNQSTARRNRKRTTLKGQDYDESFTYFLTHVWMQLGNTAVEVKRGQFVKLFE